MAHFSALCFAPINAGAKRRCCVAAGSHGVVATPILGRLRQYFIALLETGRLCRKAIFLASSETRCGIRRHRGEEPRV